MISPARFNPLRRLHVAAWPEQPPTWGQAKPRLIEAALARAQSRPSGNWYVFGASSELRAGKRPLGRTVAGVELVAWRDTEGRPIVGPGSCPHLGAPLCQARVHGDRLICHWHGLPLDASGRPDWVPFPAHDDGVLLWVRLDNPDTPGNPTAFETTETAETVLPTPVVPARPPLADSIVAVATMIGRCAPSDVLANRLDPWHGAWFHPYSFANLRVISAPPVDLPAEAPDDRFLVEVSYRVGGSLGVPVIAEFRCPDPRTVLMTIVAGEGTGSVVETHATPIGLGPDGAPRTAVVEATCAYSARRGFAVARAVSPLPRELIRRASRRLWRDDLAYAERRYALRARRAGES